MKTRLHPGFSALLEVGLLFLPSIPAYLWMWPYVEGMAAWIVQCLVYLYVLAGTLFIGRRRWSWGELGLNRQGIGFSLACGAVLIAARLLILLSIQWKVQPPALTLLSVLRDLLYYFGLVGLVEELLFRGLVYQALEDWRGVRWAIWGSSIGFLLWHIFGQGPLGGLGGLIIGLIFALIRWRAGGISGLIAVHALADLETVWLVADSNAVILGQGRPLVTSLPLMLAGLALLVLLPLYLWRLHPWLARSFAKER